MKSTIKKITSVVFAVCVSTSVLWKNSSADYSSQIEELEYEQYLLESEISELERTLAGYEENARESEEYMRIYDEKMGKKEEEIKNIRLQITALSAKINSTSKLISEKEREIDEELEHFKERLRVLYMDGNSSVTSVVVGADDFYDLLIRTELMERISRHDKEMIDSLNYNISLLNEQKNDLEDQRTQQEEKREEAKRNLDQLRDIYREHEETKEYYEAQAEANRLQTAEMRSRAEDVEYELAQSIRAQQEENERLRQQREREEEEERERQRQAQQSIREEDYYYDEADDEEYYEESYYENDEDDYYEEEEEEYYYDQSSSSSGLIWPCPNVWNITDGYGWRTIDEEGGSSDFHGGIDINKPGCYGETIVASASGTVITAGDTGNGYGIHVVIDHGGSLSTLYGHMSSCTVSSGDYVSQGQVIGYIGATGYAYGNHCHFEVRVNGDRTDPLGYLDY